jgi:D-proline reductase (dithiol) PrdB
LRCAALSVQRLSARQCGGPPNDPQSQAFTLELGLRVLESAPAPRTTVQSPLRWSSDPSWKLDYSNIERLSPDEIRRRRQEFDRQKEIARTVRDAPV